MAYLPGRNKKRCEEPPDEQKLTKRPDIDLEKLILAHETLEDVHRQIRESHIEMIMNLAIAAEYKDPATGNHILRISDNPTEVGRRLGV